MKAAATTTPDSVSEAFVIAEWTFHAGSFRLQKGQEITRLEPRVARLLSCLAAHAGRPVTRETLMDEVWPGTVVGDEALTNAINKLRKAFGDDRQHPRVIETIPKAGYRLIAPVRPLAAAGPNPAVDAGPGKPDLRSFRDFKGYRLAFAVIMAALVASASWLVLTTQQRTVAHREPEGVAAGNPSLAVLPFDNLGSNPAMEYLSDGITDDIITRLAKTPGLLVIARDSSFFYKNAGLDAKTIADKLDVGYVLQGSVRHTDNYQVINAQLIDAAAGVHTWAEQYIYSADDLFEVENKIVQSVLAVLLSEKQNDSALRPSIMPTEHMQAHNYLLLGRYHFYKFASKDENLKARRLFREAVELDPEYALAHAFLGWTYIFEAMNGWADDRPAALQEAARLATRAIELQPDLPLSYYVRGLSYREQGDKYVEALGEVETALRYDPSNANAKVLLATLLYYAGRPEVGLERIKDAMSIHPHHPYNYHFHLGQAYFVLGDYQGAKDAFLQGLASNPSAERLHVWLAASYAQSGDLENAKWEAEQVMMSNPGFSVARMEAAFPFKNPADLEHFADGLRLAGFE